MKSSASWLMRERSNDGFEKNRKIDFFFQHVSNAK